MENLTPMESFVLLVENMRDYKVAKKNASARRLLAKSLGLARALDEQLPGHDEAVKFFYEGLEYLQSGNPYLAEDIGRIMQKVYDEDRFRKR